MDCNASPFARRIRTRKAAALAGLSPKILYRAAREGKIDFYRIGNRLEFTEESITKFMRDRHVPQGSGSLLTIEAVTRG